ncbi:hypothetical protein [Streptosporangium sp. V21-05]|uniref:hypothetical protein n=1 Tax=Streptosporangium sp. V21-05 TaxID=3446115 RepID=UPI003F53AD36
MDDTPSVVDVRHQAPRRGWLRLVLVAGPVAVSAVLTLLASAYPGGDRLLTLLAVPAWFLSGLIWISLLITRGSGYRRSPWIVVTPLVAVLTLALADSGLPMRVAFLSSEPAFTRYAQSLPEQERPTSEAERVGLFTVDTARKWNGITHLDVAGTGGVLEECGFAHAPEGRVRELGVSAIDHVTGDWYATCTDYD